MAQSAVVIEIIHHQRVGVLGSLSIVQNLLFQHIIRTDLVHVMPLVACSVFRFHMEGEALALINVYVIRGLGGDDRRRVSRVETVAAIHRLLSCPAQKALLAVDGNRHGAVCGVKGVAFHGVHGHDNHVGVTFLKDVAFGKVAVFVPVKPAHIAHFSACGCGCSGKVHRFAYYRRRHVRNFNGAYFGDGGDFYGIALKRGDMQVRNFFAVHRYG